MLVAAQETCEIVCVAGGRIEKAAKDADPRRKELGRIQLRDREERVTLLIGIGWKDRVVIHGREAPGLYDDIFSEATLGGDPGEAARPEPQLLCIDIQDQLARAEVARGLVEAAVHHPLQGVSEVGRELEAVLGEPSPPAPPVTREPGQAEHFIGCPQPFQGAVQDLVGVRPGDDSDQAEAEDHGGESRGQFHHRGIFPIYRCCFSWVVNSRVPARPASKSCRTTIRAGRRGAGS